MEFVLESIFVFLDGPLRNQFYHCRRIFFQLFLCKNHHPWRKRISVGEFGVKKPDLVKVWILEHLESWWALARGVLKDFLQQLNSLIIGVKQEMTLNRRSFVYGEIFVLVLRRHLWDLLRSRCTKYFYYLNNLLFRAWPFKQGRVLEQFGKTAPCAPDIYWRAVFFVPKYQFWRSVESWTNVGGILLRVKISGQFGWTKVTYYQVVTMRCK